MLSPPEKPTDIAEPPDQRSASESLAAPDQQSVSESLAAPDQQSASESLAAPDQQSASESLAAPDQQSASEPIPGSDLEVESQRTDRSPFIPDTVGEESRAAAFPWQLPLGPHPRRPPDTALDGGETDTFVFRAASCRGARHRCEAELRQDSVYVASDPTGRWVAAAVADGVGSGDKSHVGSRFAAECAVQMLLDQALTGGGDDPTEWISQVAEQMRIEAQTCYPRLEIPDADIASTLCVVLVDSVGSGPEGELEAHLLRIGDSTAAQLIDGEWRFLFDNGADADLDEGVFGTRTASLPQQPGAYETDKCTVGTNTPLFLMTDGVSVPLRATEVRSYLASRWTSPPHPLEFLGQMEFRRRTFDDDRSAIGIWAKSP